MSNDNYDSEALLYENTFVSKEDLKDLTEKEREEFINEYNKIYKDKEKKKKDTTLTVPPIVTTYRRNVIDIDSAYRDKVFYPNANSFSYVFPFYFNNIISIKMIKSIFPNTDNVIKAGINNKIYWINEEDIDLSFPIYSISLKPGNYGADTIGTEIQTRMNLIKRRNGAGDYHYFLVTVDTNTDVIQFTSLINNQLNNNPLTTTAGSGVIVVSHTSHGYSTSQIVYLSGSLSVGGISSTNINSNYPITVIDADSYSITVNVLASTSVSGGGDSILESIRSPFKFLWGDYSDTIEKNLGFSNENSSIDLPLDPIETIILFPTVISQHSSDEIKIKFPDLPVLNTNDQVILRGFNTIPNINNKTLNIFLADPADKSIYIKIDEDFQYINTDITGTSVNTQIIQLTVPNHSFNEGKITGYNIPLLKATITTTFPHGLFTGNYIWLKGIEYNFIPDGYYQVTALTSTTFTIISTIVYPAPLFFSRLFLGFSNILTVYNAQNNSNGNIGGINVLNEINNLPLTYYGLIDNNNIYVKTPTFSTSVETGGGSGVRFTSVFDGWNGVQSNEIDENTLNSPILLNGVDYVFLCSNKLEGTIQSNTNIKNIFAEIQLDGNPGTIIYNSFIDNAKIYNPPLPILTSMDFTIKNPDGTLYNFNNVDYSFTLEVIEAIQSYQDNNLSSYLLDNKNNTTDIQNFFYRK